MGAWRPPAGSREQPPG